MNGPVRIDAVYAYVVLEADGSETIPVVPAVDERSTVEHLHIPMLAGSEPRARAMKQHLFRLPFLRGKTVQLVRYVRQDLIETIVVDDDGKETS